MAPSRERVGFLDYFLSLTFFVCFAIVWARLGAMRVNVVLPNGTSCPIGVAPESTVRELKVSAQQHFQRSLRLAFGGQMLDPSSTLVEAGLRNEDSVTAIAAFQAASFHRASLRPA